MSEVNSERVVAAVPNYNMGVHCAKLVGQLLQQDYDHVYVLDDASTDGSQQAMEPFKDNDRFKFVAGTENLGVGSNRNRILEYEQHGFVHFLDADMMPEDFDGKKVILKAFARHPGAGAIGLRVKNPDDSQYGFNFGPVMNGTGYFLDHAWKKHNKNPSSVQARILKKVFGNGWKISGPICILKTRSVNMW